MDTSKNKCNNPNPKLYANFLSRLTFGWLLQLFKYGKYYELEIKDVYNALPDDESDKLATELESCWKKERKRKEPRLLRTVLMAFGMSCHKYAFYSIVLNLFVRVALPLELNHFLTCFREDETPCVHVRASTFLGLLIVQTILTHHANFGLKVVDSSCIVMSRLSKKIGRLTEKRIFIMNELINGMKFIKMHYALCYQFPQAIKNLSSAKESLNRIRSFLLLEEVQILPRSGHDKSIILRSVNAKWTADAIVNTLRDVNLCLGPNKFYAITGSEGAGKSTLLKLLTGELSPVTGEILVPEEKSYAQQRPWLILGTIRANILFGEPYEVEHYKEILKISQLDDALRSLPFEDDTIVGGDNKVINDFLCAKINLARMMYRNADFYILDDISFEAETEIIEKLLQDCLITYLKDKTRIVATQCIDRLKLSDEIIYLSEGQVIFRGNFTDFQNDNRNLVNSLVSNDHPKKDYSTEKAFIHRSMKVDRMNSVEEFVEKMDKIYSEPKETDGLLRKIDKIQNTMLLKYFWASRSYVFICILIIGLVVGFVLMTIATHWIGNW
uniref:ABC transporter domain-containing protein n=1 Tax=Trichogramma kaykai TaxID=54128 RepID=A0ABD2W8A6_9HYME